MISGIGCSKNRSQVSWPTSCIPRPFWCKLCEHVLGMLGHGVGFKQLICIAKSISHTSKSEIMCPIVFLVVQATGKNSVGTEFSACKSGISRMNVTSVMQSFSLSTVNCPYNRKTVVLKCLCFGCTPMRKGLGDRISTFSKLKIVCDIVTV